MPRVEDDGIDDVAVCSECHSDQPLKYVINNMFFQSGEPIPCKFCGGIVIIVLRSDRERELNKLDNKRGVYHSPEDNNE